MTNLIIPAFAGIHFYRMDPRVKPEDDRDFVTASIA